MESLQVWLKTNADLWSPSASWFKDHAVAMIIIIITGMIFYYVGGRILSSIVRRLVKTARHREWHRKDVEKRQDTLAGVARNIWHLLVVFTIIIALFREGVDNADAILGPLIASAGLIGVTIGFGAQAIIRDFITGLFIIGENQYRVGDIVEFTDNASGTVERIGSRSTVIRDIEGNVHYLPNGSITHVINKTMGYSMARFVITIEPTSDIQRVTTIINKIGKELSEEEKWKNKIIDPPAFVSVGEFNATMLEIIVAGKTQPSDQWSVVAEMRRRLLETLEKSDIKLAPASTQ